MYLSSADSLADSAGRGSWRCLFHIHSNLAVGTAQHTHTHLSDVCHIQVGRLQGCSDAVLQLPVGAVPRWGATLTAAAGRCWVDGGTGRSPACRWQPQPIVSAVERACQQLLMWGAGTGVVTRARQGTAGKASLPHTGLSVRHGVFPSGCINGLLDMTYQLLQPWNSKTRHHPGTSPSREAARVPLRHMVAAHPGCWWGPAARSFSCSLLLLHALPLGGSTKQLTWLDDRQAGGC